MPRTKGTPIRRVVRKAPRAAARHPKAASTTPGKTSKLEVICVGLGGQWTPNPDGTGGTCWFGRAQLDSINFYRGDPCQDVFPGIDKYVLVPYSRTVMAALKQAMKSGL